MYDHAKLRLFPHKSKHIATKSAEASESVPPASALFNLPLVGRGLGRDVYHSTSQREVSLILLTSISSPLLPVPALLLKPDFEYSDVAIMLTVQSFMLSMVGALYIFFIAVSSYLLNITFLPFIM